MTQDDNAVDAVSLKELLAPSASSILNEGSVVRSDKSLSLWLLAQDAFGWQNWLSEHEIPFEGKAQDLFYEAAEKLQLSREEANAVLERAGTESAIPACVYKGNEDESIDGKGNLVAWGHLFNLKPAFSTYCPPEVKEAVSSYINQYRQHVPKPKRTPEQSQTTAEPEPSNEPPSSKQPPKKAAEKDPPSLRNPTTQVNNPVRAIASQNLNTTLARLGREIVDCLGEDQDDQRQVNGNVKYRIAVNLRDNTMRIYAKDRGDEPILVDANGQIDHANSNVLPEDVERFQQLVNSLRTHQADIERLQQLVTNQRIDQSAEL